MEGIKYKNYFATIIQNGYRRYLKCDRDNNNKTKISINVAGRLRKKNIYISSPIDPIYQFAFNEKYRLRIVEWDLKYKKPAIWHFNILTLLTWINKSKNWINPITNCLFKNISIIRIVEFINLLKIKRKIKTNICYNRMEPGYRLIMFKNDINTLINTIYDNNEDDNYEFLKMNLNINSLTFNIDEYVNLDIYLGNYKLSPLTALHYAIIRGNKNIVHNLIYYGSDIEKTCGDNNYTPLHLSAILNKLEIGSIILMYGADIDKKCKYGPDNILMTAYDICVYLNHNAYIDYCGIKVSG